MYRSRDGKRPPGGGCVPLAYLADAEHLTGISAASVRRGLGMQVALGLDFEPSADMSPFGDCVVVRAVKVA